ncbi:mandelate racemase/muconate lactonizing enzyme family protein [Limnoglobus roseus]|uniref:Membrane protein n=1 Tax=Limnoglobus roseus TaxID=2598579 RepID=A0A5C1AES7_9BACT|nr:mandelate racemase/muconate lactonizing enzyme family protein [Limnoglobus roseus]QEL16202.1 membrane protein [Limnoglobus roseus]
MPGTDIRIKDVTFGYEDYRYRTPIKFGGVALDKVTLLNVEMTVETVGGKVATGFGSMPLGNVWAWPSRAVGYDETLAAMKQLADAVAAIYRACPMAEHPIEITHALESQFFRGAEELCSSERMPKLAALVVASAFDAALHDAFGKAHGQNCYQTYGPEFLRHDLGHFLGTEFAGQHLSQFLAAEPQPRMPLYHLVGALDPLTPADVKQPVGDGLPETLGDWIIRDGLTHLKIKLNGDDQNWDVARVVEVNRVADASAAGHGFHFSLDFNERCQNVEYLLEVLRRIRDESPNAFARIQYVEQPTARDLKANPANKMHEAAKLKPVVIDESLLDLETLLLAREMGYTGVAFKACKGQSQTLLLAAAAQHFGLFRCVQDLTCVGASLIHSAGIAAHVPGVAAIESNGRQYCPAANAAWESRFPDVFTIRDGTMNTGLLTGLGLGAV